MILLYPMISYYSSVLRLLESVAGHATLMSYDILLYDVKSYVTSFDIVLNHDTM